MAAVEQLTFPDGLVAAPAAEVTGADVTGYEIERDLAAAGARCCSQRARPRAGREEARDAKTTVELR